MAMRTVETALASLEYYSVVKKICWRFLFLEVDIDCSLWCDVAGILAQTAVAALCDRHNCCSWHRF